MIMLIETANLTLHEFEVKATPPYATFSYRWEKEKLTLKDLTKGRNLQKKGWHKVQEFCKYASENGLKYGWIDTWCIDKSSSAELSEAVNSMFTWYRNSVICYAYLCDVPYSSERQHWLNDFAKSTWYTRGWTLQELLAPQICCFWALIGSAWTLQDDSSRNYAISPEFRLIM